ncbi:CxxxxCH/CxxCH domain-containing protein [Geobacter pelophilus]|uniref:CxxxxCH/CxxCH domain-containing protein n=1 Tax=Geoanaerobacter pelophilus TaxID=60036 RepID=A0AAW4L8F0_9BACT|nr:CxxxxCH/CxxCH domain-containing protein [Geoanaerobacter pelophilus]MBT0663476.1 CxxxxCH/CxxCH domain-containing protein [Geoanaerobacter pelophilus]
MFRLMSAPRFACLITFFSLLSAIPVFAIECYQCHGGQTPQDYRPIDAGYRNISTGGFQGSHRTHMATTAVPVTCSRCHQGAAEYGPGHANRLIELAPNINSSPLAAVYRNGSTAFPQRPVPRLGSCSNVNCHFERETKVWGVPPLTVPDGCKECHGAPPGGGDSGAAGSHPQHDLYFPGASGCVKCHTDHTKDAFPFNHATSVGRGLLLGIQNPVSSVRSLYSGALNDYLPKSSSNQFGSCSNVYCHSKGDSLTSYQPNVVPSWGISLPGDCSGCHGNGHGTGTEIVSGSHTIHVGKDFYGQYVYQCSTCHFYTAAGSQAIANRANHVNSQVDVSLAPSFGGVYTADGHAPGAPVGTCQNVYCHSNVQPDGGIGGPTAYNTPEWGDAGSIQCGGCHAGDGGHGHGGVKMATGSHTRHLAYSFTTTTNTVKCMVCHKYTNQPFVTSCYGNPLAVEYGNTVCHWGTGELHANGKVNVRIEPTFGNMSAYQGSPEPGNGYANCTNTYCHSNGTAIATGVNTPSATPNWGSGAIGCTSCHGYPPNYANGTPKANSHARHSTCNLCHYGTTTNGVTITNMATHVNKAYDLAPGSGVSFSYTYASTGGTCSSISCHGGASAVWGATIQCGGCHEVPPATPSHLKHFSGSGVEAAYGDVRIAQDFSANATGYLMNCGNCHPLDQAKHGNGAVDVELFNALAPAGSLKARNPSAAAYSNGTTVHTDSRGFRYTNGTCSSVYCHSYNEWTTPGGVANYTNYSTYLPPNLVETRNYRPVTWNGSALTCSGCHANPPRTRYPDNDLGSGDSHSWINAGGEYNAPYVNGVEERHNANMGYGPMSCRTCHYETLRVANTWTLYTSNSQYMWNAGDVPISNYSKHVNGSGSVDFDRTDPVVYNTYWSGTVTMNLNSAQYDVSRKTCSNVSCHQDQKLIRWGVPYDSWTNQCYVCHSY